jgi:hypothetical protein
MCLLFAGAIRIYCAGQLFEKARRLAGNNATFITYIDDQYNQFLLQNQVRAGTEAASLIA